MMEFLLERGYQVQTSKNVFITIDKTNSLKPSKVDLKLWLERSRRANVEIGKRWDSLGERAKGELVWKEKPTTWIMVGETGVGANWEEKILCQT